MSKSHSKNIDVTDLLGKEFKFGAQGPTSYDCYHLCKEVCNRADIHLPDQFNLIDYVNVMEEVEKRSAAFQNGKKDFIKLDKPKPFCLVGFKMLPPFVTHVGVVLGDCKTFIHIMENTRVSIERLDRKIWKNKLDGFYEYTKSI
jgi:cell wall-associated NlpC family hydrolase